MNIETKLELLIRLFQDAKSDLFFCTTFSQARKDSFGHALFALTCYSKKHESLLLAVRRRHSERAVGFAAKALAIIRATAPRA